MKQFETRFEAIKIQFLTIILSDSKFKLSLSTSVKLNENKKRRQQTVYLIDNATQSYFD